MVRAVDGENGELIWEHDTGRAIEAGPMLSDLDGDGNTEIIVVTGNEQVPGEPRPPRKDSALLIYRHRRQQSGLANQPICVLDAHNLRNFPGGIVGGAGPGKLDSGEPAIVDLNSAGSTNSKTLVFGAWNGYLNAVWFDLSNNHGLIPANARLSRISVSEIAHGTEGQLETSEPEPRVRTSPLIWKFGDVETAVFGWMGASASIASSRISAVGMTYDNRSRRVEFRKKWTRRRVVIEGENWNVMAWKSSVGLLPLKNGDPLVVSAGGIGNLEIQTGYYGRCDDNVAKGWVGAFHPNDGTDAWSFVYRDEGNIRGSCAIADLDGDGNCEVVIPFGCRGKLRCYGFDEHTRHWAERWNFQLGDEHKPWTQRSMCSPSIGDVDGDGLLEVVASAIDGHVYCLGGSETCP
jgi:hypothetical protein